MKRIIVALLVLITAQQAWAQHAEMQTLFSPKKNDTKKRITVGGYGTAVGKLTSLNGELGVLSGVEGGVLLNHKLMLGAAGYGLTNNISAPHPTNPSERKEYLQFWYTGLMAEYTHNSDKLVHWSVGGLLGGGGVGRREGRWRDIWNDNDHNGNGWYDGSGFFVAEPFAGVEVNVTHWLRINAGGSYRFIAGSDTPGIKDSDLSGPSFKFGIKAGKF